MLYTTDASGEWCDVLLAKYRCVYKRPLVSEGSTDNLIYKNKVKKNTVFLTNKT